MYQFECPAASSNIEIILAFAIFFTSRFAGLPLSSPAAFFCSGPLRLSPMMSYRASASAFAAGLPLSLSPALPLASCCSPSSAFVQTPSVPHTRRVQSPAASFRPPSASLSAPAPEQHRLTAGERARTVATVCRNATLCTSSAKHAGVPFGSHVDYVLDSEGCPVFLLAAAAAHTKNIDDAPAVSLYCQPSKSSGQAGGRVTLVGEIALLDDEEALAEVKDEYIIAHAHAADALEYPDLFAFYRMSVKDVYFVGGFGVVAQWVDAVDFAAADPDPLAFDSAEIMAEINSARGAELTRLG
jgi:hypothetical protein